MSVDEGEASGLSVDLRGAIGLAVESAGFALACWQICSRSTFASHGRSWVEDSDVSCFVNRVGLSLATKQKSKDQVRRLKKPI